MLQIQTLHFRIIYIHGHQDNNKQIKELETSAKLNIDVDKLVTPQATTPINTHLLSSTLSIYVKNNIYLTNLIERFDRTLQR